jgi:hypothetical protein
MGAAWYDLKNRKRIDLSNSRYIVFWLNPFLRFHHQVNVADGFLTNFMVAQSDLTEVGEEGFAFVMQRQG